MAQAGERPLLISDKESDHVAAILRAFQDIQEAKDDRNARLVGVRVLAHALNSLKESSQPPNVHPDEPFGFSRNSVVIIGKCLNPGFGPVVQSLACAVLKNVAFKNNVVKDAIRRCEIIPALISAADSANEKLQWRALSALWVCCLNNDANKKYVSKTDGKAIFLRAMKSEKLQSVSAAFSCLGLVNDVEGNIVLTRDQCELFVKLVASPDRYVSGQAVSAFVRCFKNEPNVSLLIDAGLTEQLIDSLKQGAASEASSLAEALQICCKTSESARTIFKSRGAIKQLIACLSGDGHTIDAALECISETQANEVPAATLLELLRGGDPKRVDGVLRVIALIIQDDSQRIALVRAGVMPLLFELFQSHLKHISIVNIIRSLAKSEDARDVFWSHDGLTFFTRYLDADTKLSYYSLIVLNAFVEHPAEERMREKLIQGGFLTKMITSNSVTSSSYKRRVLVMLECLASQEEAHALEVVRNNTVCKFILDMLNSEEFSLQSRSLRLLYVLCQYEDVKKRLIELNLITRVCALRIPRNTSESQGWFKYQDLLVRRLSTTAAGREELVAKGIVQLYLRVLDPPFEENVLFVRVYCRTLLVFLTLGAARRIFLASAFPLMRALTASGNRSLVRQCVGFWHVLALDASVGDYVGNGFCEEVIQQAARDANVLEIMRKQARIGVYRDLILRSGGIATACMHLRANADVIDKVLALKCLYMLCVGSRVAKDQLQAAEILPTIKELFGETRHGIGERAQELYDSLHTREGTPIRELQRLPVSSVTDLAADWVCSICFDSADATGRVRRLPCMHFFHCSCIDTWLYSNDSCPMCKSNVSALLAEMDHAAEQEREMNEAEHDRDDGSESPFSDEEDG